MLQFLYARKYHISEYLTALLTNASANLSEKYAWVYPPIVFPEYIPSLPSYIPLPRESFMANFASESHIIFV